MSSLLQVLKNVFISLISLLTLLNPTLPTVVKITDGDTRVLGN